MPRAPLPLAAVLLCCSGAAAIIYQLVWLRRLGLVFGVTVHAATAVLAAFMAGLALGSLAAGRLADRVRAPFGWFGGVEILIGVSALATPVLLTLLHDLSPVMHAWADDRPAVLTALRFGGSLAVLLVPTTLMGATLPFALRSVIASAEPTGRVAAVLYATNTAGALAGALAAGYLLIARIGLTPSLRIAALLNLLAGATALVTSRRLARRSPLRPTTVPPGSRAPGPSDREGPRPAESAPALARRAAHATAGRQAHAGRVPEPPGAALGGEPGGDPAAASSGPRRDALRRDRVERSLVLAVFALSGFVALALEVVWFRALVMFLPATTYAFTTILAVVLGGIAAGSALAAPVLGRERDWLLWIGALELAIALAAVGSLAALSWTYAAGWRTGATLQASAMAILPVSLLMGAAFPVGLHRWVAGAALAGQRVARFYAANVAAGILGPPAAGFWLIPRLGTRGAALALAALTTAAALVVLAADRRRGRAAVLVAALGIAAVVAAARALPDPLAAVLGRRYPGERVLWRHEGVQSTVSVHQRADGTRVMYLDGLHQANDSAPMRIVHRLIGTLPMALHPDPRRALVIGLGGGTTAGAVATFPGAVVDIVELSDGVVRAADWFRHINGDVLRQPNVRLHVDDGRNYLLRTPGRYDVITADIIQPFHAGAGNLYSVEYFRLGRAALDEDGVMLQWIGHRPRSQYQLIARTFLSVFPDATVWAGGTLLAGTRAPLRLSLARLRQRIADPAVGAAFGRAGIVGASGLVGLFTAGPDELRRFIGPGPVLTDDRPLVEYFLSLPRGEPDIDLRGLRGDVTRYLAP